MGLATITFDWIRDHEHLLEWLGVVSVVTFVGSLVAIPWLIVRIPADYFVHHEPFLKPHESAHPIVRGLLHILKNAVGVLLVLAGIAMLVLPGQGILTILIGLLMIDFPGKHALERWLLRQPAVLKSINWIRHRAKRPKINLPESDISSPPEP